MNSGVDSFPDRHDQVAPIWTRKFSHGACPCLSGQPAKKCCYATASIWRKKASHLKAPIEKPYAHKKCVFNRLNECDEKITHEHYIPRSILEIVKDGNEARVSGMPWLKPGTFQSLSINSLTSNILCKRHNSMMSPLDVGGKALFRAISNFGKQPKERRKNERQTFFVCSGHDVERWMLKTICSMIGAKVALNSDRETLERSQIPDWWLDVIFKGVELQPPNGLYIHGRIDQRIKFNGDFGFATISSQKQPVDHLAGAIFTICGLQFLLLLRSDLIELPNDWRYRISYFNFPVGSIKQSLCFSWF